MIGKIFFLGVLALSHSRPDRSSGSLARRDCPPSGHLLLPHENDSMKFYFCEWGSRREPPSVCAVGTVFSFGLQKCDWPWNVNNESESDESGHNDDVGNHDVEEDKFDGIGGNGEDSNNDEDSSGVDHGDKEDYDFGSNNGNEVNDENGSGEGNDDDLPNGCPADFTVHRMLPHKSNCGKFYYCVGGKTISKHCSPGLYFNPDISVCDWPRNVQCESSGDGADGDNETDEGGGEDLEDEGNDDDGNGNDDDNDGGSDEGTEGGGDLANGCPANFTVHRLIPHEDDCSKFYYCVLGATVLKQCPPGLYFNPNISVCDWLWNVNCETDDTDNEDSEDNEDAENDGVESDEDIGDSEVGDEDGGHNDDESAEGDNSEEGDDSEEDDNGTGGDDGGNDNDDDGGAVVGDNFKKKKLEVVAEVIVRLRRRNQRSSKELPRHRELHGLNTIAD